MPSHPGIKLLPSAEGCADLWGSGMSEGPPQSHPGSGHLSPSRDSSDGHFPLNLWFPPTLNRTMRDSVGDECPQKVWVALVKQVCLS